MKSAIAATSPLPSGQVQRSAVILAAVAVASRRGEGKLPSRRPARRRRYFLIAFKISLAAFAPEAPVSPTPGCVPLPHKYKFSMGVR